MENAIHGDLSRRACEDSSAMDWAASPSPSVWRKRLHRVGPAESGQVTSVVRYQPNSWFAPHDHPEGEEILVLEGTFSDEHGDWPAGTYLLNPEGFRHAPFSKEGCVIFVKLRQYPGRERRHVVIDTGALAWKPGDSAGLELKPLYQQEGYSDTVRIERWAPGAARPDVTYPLGAELFVLEGAFEDELGRHAAGSWLRLPAGDTHRPGSESGCVVYLKRGGLPYLRAAAGT